MGRLRLVDRGTARALRGRAAPQLRQRDADRAHHDVSRLTTSLDASEDESAAGDATTARAHYYVVLHGDNFYEISLGFHLTLELLRSLNRGVNEHALQTGQRIRVG